MAEGPAGRQSRRPQHGAEGAHTRAGAACAEAASPGPGRPVVHALRTLRLSRQQGAREAAAAAPSALALPQPATRARTPPSALPAESGLSES